MQNRGLILTASHRKVWPNDPNEKAQEKLDREYRRRRANREMVSNLFIRNSILPTQGVDLTRPELEAAIRDTFSGADEKSYSYLYINCHGSPQGVAICMDGDYTTEVSYADLRRLLDKVPGTKVILLETCHSGSPIEEARSVTRSLRAAFRSGPSLRSAEFRAPKYKVLAACTGDTYAWGDVDGGFFTRKWCMAAGWNWSKKEAGPWRAQKAYADYVTLPEICAYTKKDRDHKKDGRLVDQDDLCYPEMDLVPVFGKTALRDDALPLLEIEMVAFYPILGFYAGQHPGTLVRSQEPELYRPGNVYWQHWDTRKPMELSEVFEAGKTYAMYVELKIPYGAKISPHAPVGIHDGEDRILWDAERDVYYLRSLYTIPAPAPVEIHGFYPISTDCPGGEAFIHVQAAHVVRYQWEVQIDGTWFPLDKEHLPDTVTLESSGSDSTFTFHPQGYAREVLRCTLTGTDGATLRTKAVSLRVGSEPKLDATEEVQFYNLDKPAEIRALGVAMDRVEWLLLKNSRPHIQTLADYSRAHPEFSFEAWCNAEKTEAVLRVPSEWACREQVKWICRAENPLGKAETKPITLRLLNRRPEILEFPREILLSREMRNLEWTVRAKGDRISWHWMGFRNGHWEPLEPEHTQWICDHGTFRVRRAEFLLPFTMLGCEVRNDMGTDRAEISLLWVPDARPEEGRRYLDEASSGHWSRKAQDFVRDTKIFDPLFDGKTVVSRSMLAMALWRYAGSPPAGFSQVYTDVPGDSPAWSGCTWMKPWVPEDQFLPDATVRREEGAVLLYRLAQYLGYETPSLGMLSAFADGTDTDHPTECTWAVGQGILRGDGQNCLHLRSPLTRTELAVMLLRFAEAVDR